MLFKENAISGMAMVILAWFWGIKKPQSPEGDGVIRKRFLTQTVSKTS